MAKLLRPGEEVEFLPPGEEAKPEGERTVYTLRAPTLYDRVAWRRAIAVKGGRRHPPLVLLACLRRGVEELMAESPEETRLPILAAIDEQRGRLDRFYARVQAREFSPGSGSGVGLGEEEGARAFLAALAETEKGAEALALVAQTVAAGHPPYAAMIAENEVYWEIAGIEAARLFLAGWSGPGLPAFRRTRAGVPDELLAAIPERHLPAIAGKVEELMAPGEAEQKNSASPPPTQP